MAASNGGSIDTNQEQILALTTKINTNNTDLNSILATINNLPSANSGTTEDLSTELTEQDTLITTQETTIDSIISALEGKTVCSGTKENVTLTINYTIDSTRHGYLTYMYYNSAQNLCGSYKLITSSSGTSTSISVAKGSYVHVAPSLATATDLTMSNSTLSTTNINDASNAITIQVNETGSFSVSIEETQSSSGGTVD